MSILRKVSFAFICTFVLLVSGMLVPSSHAAIPNASVAGIWSLDNVDGNIAKDLSGRGNDGKVSGGPVLVAGKFGQAVKFDGKDDFIDCGAAASLNLGKFTVSFWAMLPATQGWNHMVSKGSHVGSGTPGSVNWGVMMYDAAATFLAEIYTDTAWTGVTGPVVPLNVWQHIAVTYDGDKMEFFLNGKSVGVTAAGVKIKLDATRSFRIGGIASAGVTPDNFFNGSIDEVGFFNVVLSPTDILSIMNSGLTVAVTPVTSSVASENKSATTWAEIKSQ
jgi:hypothetical protein